MKSTHPMQMRTTAGLATGEDMTAPCDNVKWASSNGDSMFTWTEGGPGILPENWLWMASLLK